MNKIYYDPTGGFLYGIDSNNNPKIVKTDACVMMPENVLWIVTGIFMLKTLMIQRQSYKMNLVIRLV